MKFCPLCGSWMRMKYDRKTASTVYECSSCGHRISEGKVVKKSVSEETGPKIEVRGAGQKDVPTIDAVCPKCGYGKAVWWMQQTRSGDEPSTRFYRCLRSTCKHTWREYE